MCAHFGAQLCAQCAQCTQLCAQCSAEDSNIMIGDHGGFSLFSSGNGSFMQEHVKLKSEVGFSFLPFLNAALLL